MREQQKKYMVEWCILIALLCLTAVAGLLLYMRFDTCGWSGAL
jgi:membrane protein insertase Oxa1/YidC/SpoIIIJ